jgi:hypothetical protein
MERAGAPVGAAQRLARHVVLFLDLADRVRLGRVGGAGERPHDGQPVLLGAYGGFGLSIRPAFWRGSDAAVSSKG